MSVDSAIYYKGIWTYLRVLGVAYGTPVPSQQHNGTRIYNTLRTFGYSHSAACGILGNMQLESGLSPGCLQSGSFRDALPNAGEHIADLTNQVMLGFYNPNNTGGCGTGLIQWDGYNNESQPFGNIITSFASRYDQQWFDGDLQLFRFVAEYTLDPTGWGGINGTTKRYWHLLGSSSPSINWTDFMNYNGTPEDAAELFRKNRERSGDSQSGIQHRQENARYWYNLFQNQTVTRKLHAKYMADVAYLFRDSAYPYGQGSGQYDCVSFINRLCRRRLGFNSWSSNGTNSLWRDVEHENPFQWKGTIAECRERFNGEIPRGAYLFKIYPEGSPGYNTIPDRYRGDGVGNVDHIGVYTDLGKGVMQAGGYDAGAKPSPGKVADCAFHPEDKDLDYEWWTHVALDADLIFSDEYTPPGTDFPVWMLFKFKRKEWLKNERKWF